MTKSSLLKRAFFPEAQISELKTALSFTDILFGFVIFELFRRLTNWNDLPGFARWQLIAGTALVLGSWIGFRRSLNRASYELKFFNLPLARFMLDQVMVLLYFRIAVLTPSDPEPSAAPLDAGSLTDATFETLVWIFVLYALWDLAGIVMATAWSGAPKYSEIKRDWRALAITLTFLALFVVVDRVEVGTKRAEYLFVVATILLLAYRWAKEVKTSWRIESERTSPTDGA